MHRATAELKATGIEEKALKAGDPMQPEEFDLVILGGGIESRRNPLGILREVHRRLPRRISAAGDQESFLCLGGVRRPNGRPHRSYPETA